MSDRLYAVFTKTTNSNEYGYGGYTGRTEIERLYRQRDGESEDEFTARMSEIHKANSKRTEKCDNWVQWNYKFLTLED